MHKKYRQMWRWGGDDDKTFLWDSLSWGSGSRSPLVVYNLKTSRGSKRDDRSFSLANRRHATTSETAHYASWGNCFSSKRFHMGSQFIRTFLFDIHINARMRVLHERTRRIHIQTFREETNSPKPKLSAAQSGINLHIGDFCSISFHPDLESTRALCNSGGQINV